MRPIRLYWFAAGLLLLSGCSDAGPQRASVSGTVLVDGQPFEEGTINFFPVGDTQGPSAGAVIEKGEYQIERQKGVVVGQNRVEIQGNRKTGRKIPDPMGSGALVDELVEALPPECNSKSTLSRTVTSGHNTINFDQQGTRTGK